MRKVLTGINTDFVKERMRELGFNTMSLARETNTSHVTISRLAKGIQKPTEKTWKAICHVLNLDSKTGSPIEKDVIGSGKITLKKAKDKHLWAYVIDDISGVIVVPERDKDDITVFWKVYYDKYHRLQVDLDMDKPEITEVFQLYNFYYHLLPLIEKKLEPKLTENWLELFYKSIADEVVDEKMNKLFERSLFSIQESRMDRYEYYIKVKERFKNYEKESGLDIRLIVSIQILNFLIRKF